MLDEGAACDSCRDCVMALVLQTLREDPVGHWQREIPPGWCPFAQAQPDARPVGFHQVCHPVHNQEPILGFLVLAGCLAPRQLGDKRSFAVQIDLRRVETADRTVQQCGSEPPVDSVLPS